MTRFLASLGCDLPKTLMEADSNNPMGYWESTEIVSLNDAILDAADSCWDDWVAFNSEWYESPVAGDFLERAETILASEFGNSRLFVLKDPRVCRLLEFWKESFDRIHAVPVVVLPIRNPLEVAASLRERDELDPSIGVLVWLRYVLDAEEGSRGLRRAFMRYGDVLEDRKNLAGRLGSELQLTWPARRIVDESDMQSLISSSIRHHVRDDDRIHDDPLISRWVKTVFEILNRWTRGEVRTADADTLDSIKMALNDCAPNFRRPIALGRQAIQRNRQYEVQVDALDQNARLLEQAVVSRDGQIADLDKAVRERDQRVADRDSQLASVSRSLNERDQQIAERDSQLASVSRSLNERDQQIAERDSQLASVSRSLNERDQQIAERDDQLAFVSRSLNERDQQIGERDSQIAERDSRIAERDGRISEQNSWIAEQNSQIAERDTQIESLDRTIVERDGQIAERDTQIESLDRTIVERDGQIAEQNSRIAERDGQIAERDTQIESLDRTIVERDSQIEAIYGSTSWRITRPLRGVESFLSRLLRGASRLLSAAIFGCLGFIWRLIPLGALRQRVKGPLLGLLPKRFVDRHLGRRMRPARRYVASGWLQLADRNSDCANSQGDTPILFDPVYYLAANEDVRNSGADPLRHYLSHGAVEGRLPFALDREDIDPLIESLHRIDLRQDDVFAFDPGFYRDLHPDLPPSTDEVLLDHYCRHGREESRAGSRGEFVLELCDNPREIPLDFKASEYVDLYPDLTGLDRPSPLAALRHYMCSGRSEPRLHTRRGDEAMVPPAPASIDMPAELAEARPLCVLAHVFYPDLWEELAGFLANLPENAYDLYVNLVETTWTREFEQSVRDDFPTANIVVSPNVGRDIGGHFQLLRNVAMEDYRFFCLVHSKKSPHLAIGDSLLWRRRLLTPLLGTRELAVENLKLMLTDDTVGLIGSRVCRDTELRGNMGKFTELMDMLDVKPESRDVEFVSGTMMYLRREILERIFETCKDLPFEKGDDTPLHFHLDAQWAHAIERVIGNVVLDMDYRFEWR